MFQINVFFLALRAGFDLCLFERNGFILSKQNNFSVWVKFLFKNFPKRETEK